MIIERADYPTLEKKDVLLKLVTLAETLEDLLREYWQAGGDLNATFRSEVNEDGVEVFWVHPPLEDKRPACAWTLSAQGCQVTKGEMTFAGE